MTTISSLIKSQKKVIRIINKVHRFYHSHNLFKNMKLLKFKDLVDYKISIIMFKASKNMLPLNVQKLFTRLDSNYTLCSKGNFYKSQVRTSKKAKCISVYGVKLFNQFNNNLKNAINIHVFKRLYKSLVFQKYLDAERVVIRY